MTNQKPIEPMTPPCELVQQWIAEGNCQTYCTTDAYLISKVAQWGYEQRGAVNEAALQKARDEQLDQCCNWLDGYESEGWAAEQMREAFRPKPKSQAEEALKAIGVPTKIGEARVIEHNAHELIRAALERLRELEGNQ